jgi:hypothetical protein
MCFDCMQFNNITCTFEINHFRLGDIDDERCVGKEKGSHVKITIPVYVDVQKLKMHMQ